MAADEEKLCNQLVKLAIFKHLVATIVSAFSYNVFESQDLSAELNFPVGATKSKLEELILFFLGGLNNWDALFYIEISENDYQYEKNHAFFPLFPYMLRCLRDIFTFFLPISLNDKVKIILLAYLLNMALFMISVVVLYKLSLVALNNKLLSSVATVFYIFGPGSIFYVASYTETIFTLLIFLVGYYSLQIFEFKSSKQPWVDSEMKAKFSVQSFIASLVCIFLATLARSNGLVLISIPGYLILSKFLGCALVKSPHSTARFKKGLVYFALGVITFLSAFLAYVLVMGYIYKLYCLDKSGDEVGTWCYQRIPDPYGHIQTTFWQNGFLNSFALKYSYYLACGLPHVLISFQFFYKFFIKDGKYFISFILNKQTPPKHSLYDNEKVYPFLIYHVVLACVCTFFALIQCSYRFLSTCPTFFWHLAHEFSEFKKDGKVISFKNWTQVLLIIYCVIFNIFGMFFFSNFNIWF